MATGSFLFILRNIVARLSFFLFNDLWRWIIFFFRGLGLPDCLFLFRGLWLPDRLFFYLSYFANWDILIILFILASLILFILASLIFKFNVRCENFWKTLKLRLNLIFQLKKVKILNFNKLTFFFKSKIYFWNLVILNLKFVRQRLIFGSLYIFLTNLNLLFKIKFIFYNN